MRVTEIFDHEQLIIILHIADNIYGGDTKATMGPINGDAISGRSVPS